MSNLKKTAEKLTEKYAFSESVLVPADKPNKEERLIAAGKALANICFNLGQESGPLSTASSEDLARFQHSMRKAYKEWDGALKDYSTFR